MPQTVEQQLKQIRPQLLRFANLQLRDAATAEDMVQETLAAAMSKAAQFAQNATWQTWVFAILKNKIIDNIRHSQRHVFESLDAAEMAIDSAHAQHFDNGNWRADHKPQDWGDPESYASQYDFVAILKLCLENLPKNTAKIFIMKEVLELSTQEIMDYTGISLENCHTTMHRARNGLRGCLQKHWFNA